MGFEVVYDDSGNIINTKPRAVDTYKQAEVRDSESFSQKKPKLDTFGQWYELALNTLFQNGVVIPIEELMIMMPIELEAFFSAHDRRLIYTQKMAMFEAWHVAAFERQEKLPDLEPILRRIDRQSNKETQSKFTQDEARKIIEQDQKDTEAAERARQVKTSNKQAKQSDDGRIK
jgi:hypothetical protein